MRISRYVNSIPIDDKKLSDFYLDNEIISKTIFIVNNRLKNNGNLTLMGVELTKKSS